MAIEKRKFENIDYSWRKIMEAVQKEPLIYDFIDSDKLNSEFESYNKTLEEIQRNLSDYLETKRRFFYRFYFLGDEELIELVS